MIDSSRRTVLTTVLPQQPQGAVPQVFAKHKDKPSRQGR